MQGFGASFGASLLAAAATGARPHTVTVATFNTTALALSPNRGYCIGVTGTDHDCAAAFQGSFAMKSGQNQMQTQRDCIEKCRACPRCNFVSYSAEAADCTWTYWCNVAHLKGTFGHAIEQSFQTLQVRDAPPLAERFANPVCTSNREAGNGQLPCVFISPLPVIAHTPSRWDRAPAVAAPGQRVSDLLGLPTAVHRAAVDTAFGAFARRLARPAAEGGAPLTIVTFGTSVTAGFGGDLANSFSGVLERLLRARYPASPLRVVQRAFPSATPAFLRQCVESLAPEAADLYVVELMDNAGAMGQTRVAEQFGKDLRGILRRFAGRCAGAEEGRRQPALLILAPLMQGCVRRLVHLAPFHKLEPFPYDEAGAQAATQACALWSGDKQLVAKLGKEGTFATIMEQTAADLGIGVLSMRRELQGVLAAAARGGVSNALGGVSNLTR